MRHGTQHTRPCVVMFLQIMNELMTNTLRDWVLKKTREEGIKRDLIDFDTLIDTHLTYRENKSRIMDRLGIQTAQLVDRKHHAIDRHHAHQHPHHTPAHHNSLPTHASEPQQTRVHLLHDGVQDRCWMEWHMRMTTPSQETSPPTRFARGSLWPANGVSGLLYLAGFLVGVVMIAYGATH